MCEYESEEEKRFCEKVGRMATWQLGRRAFEIDSGIVQPIRAIVKRYNRLMLDFPRIAEDVRDMGTYELLNNLQLDELCNSPTLLYDFEKYKNLSTVVGYFTARKVSVPNSSDFSIGFGCSFCIPNDFKQFNRYEGLTRAYHARIMCPSVNHAIEMFHDYDFSQGFLNVESLWMKKKSLYIVGERDNVTTVYYFPIKLERQYNLFLERCLKYYKH